MDGGHYRRPHKFYQPVYPSSQLGGGSLIPVRNHEQYHDRLSQKAWEQALQKEIKTQNQDQVFPGKNC